MNGFNTSTLSILRSYIIACLSDNISLCWVLLLSLSYGSKNSSTERLSHLPNVTELVSDRARTYTKADWLRSPDFEHTTLARDKTCDGAPWVLEWGNSSPVQHHWGRYIRDSTNANASRLQGHWSRGIKMPRWCPWMLLSVPWVRKPLHKASKAFLVSLTWLDKKILIMSMQKFLLSSCCDLGSTPGPHPGLLNTAIPFTHFPGGSP